MSLPLFRNQCPNWNVLFQINFRDELRCRQKGFSSRKACVKGLCVTSLQPRKPRGVAKLCVSTGSVPELKCSVLLLCSLGFNCLILVMKFAMFRSHRQVREQYCEWAVKISTGRGKVTALVDLLATNLKIYMSRGTWAHCRIPQEQRSWQAGERRCCSQLGWKEDWTWVSTSA